MNCSVNNTDMQSEHHCQVGHGGKASQPDDYQENLKQITDI